jgi:phage terminase large subunit GpA-like protein
VAAEPGKYYSSRMPWQAEMLDSITDPTVGENVWLMAKRTGKTTCLIATTGYYTHHNPSPILTKSPQQEGT